MKTYNYKSCKTVLNGEYLTGDTYPIKDYIKSNLAGKWDAGRKAWKVDTEMVEKYWANYEKTGVASTESRRGQSDAIIPQGAGSEYLHRHMSRDDSDL